MTDEPRGRGTLDAGRAAAEIEPPHGADRGGLPEIEPERRAADEAAIERRLRRLGSACAVVAAAVLVAAGAIGWGAARAAGGTDWLASPPVGSFLTAFGAMLLVLLSSAVHGRILRLSVPRRETAEAAAGPGTADAAEEVTAEAMVEDGGSGAGADRDAERRRRRAWPAERLRAYSWAIGIGFAMLGVAAALGATVAIAGRAPFYGLVVCLASLLGMAARWPRRSAFEVALEAERQPPPQRTGRGAA